MADFSNFIREVKNANDIVNVIGSYISLNKRGQDYWARCPFHGEKTASFSVSQSKQIFMCFGCHESGDVIEFVKKYESVTTMEALEILAKRANIEIPEFSPLRLDKQLAEKKKKQDVYYAILTETARFYYRQFHSANGDSVRQYMASRGFSEQICKKFGVGYSPDANSLVNHLSSKGFDLNACKEIGVLQQSNKGRFFDALFERLIIPIFDINKKVIAFGGRALKPSTEQFGKYKNTGETPLFKKKNNLYAINFVKEQKQQANLPYIIVVEGYMDVLSLFQAGVVRCVASMGTSLTEQQAKLMSRLVNTVYICYDGDSAGQNATIRGMDILATAGLEVKVVTVPDNLDPDEYVKNNGADALANLIEQALPLTDYKLTALERQFDLHNTANAEYNSNVANYLKGAIEVLKGLDEVARIHYVELVCQKSRYSKDFVLRKLNETTVNEVETAQFAPVKALTMVDSALCFVASAILANQPYAQIDQKPLTDVAFLQGVYDYIFECKQKGEKPSADMVYTCVPNASKEEYMQVCGRQFPSQTMQADKLYFDECLKILQNERLKARRKQMLDEVVREGLSEQKRQELMAKIQEINDKINN